MLTNLKRQVARSVNYSYQLPGGTLTIPVIDGVGRAHRDAHEPHMEALFKRLYTPGATLVDVGVNIGQTLIKFVSVAGKTAPYVGFEPNARAASYVDELILRNGLTNAMVVPVGLGASPRIASLLVGTEGTTDPGASINAEMRDADFYGAKKAVAILNGDEAFAQLGLNERPMILKIDVEGAELEVLQGLPKTLTELRPAVVLEVLPPGGFSQAVNAYRVDQGERLKQFMADHGYKVHPVAADGSLTTGHSPTNDYLFLPD